MRHIDNTQTGLLSFVGEIENPPAAGPSLNGHSLAAIAIAVEVIVTKKNDIFDSAGRCA